MIGAYIGSGIAVFISILALRKANSSPKVIEGEGDIDCQIVHPTKSNKVIYTLLKKKK